ncbi:MAG: glycosyltransferase [Sphingobacteriales bacterium]|nr:glycosyltransferase [Sphingobacteriales bacterium]
MTPVLIPHISICIPAYKNVTHLSRLLDSIRQQTFKDFEVIITDDSPDSSIDDFIKQANYPFEIRYFKNSPAAGSPENWNISIRHAIGKWIKIMHDDDWFSDENSLNEFYTHSINTQDTFLFSGFENVYFEKGNSIISKISFLEKLMLKITPLAIYRKNYIGHPSTTLIKNDRQDWFDKTLKWVVDIEFYIRLLREKKSFHAINKSLICIGMGAEQITQTAFYNKQIELPENFYLLNKLGKNALKNIFFYDHFWRLMRNLDIKSVDEIKTYTTDMAIPKEIESMIQKIQKSGAAHLKRNGALSKIGMLMRFGIYRLGF